MTPHSEIPQRRCPYTHQLVKATTCDSQRTAALVITNSFLDPRMPIFFISELYKQITNREKSAKLLDRKLATHLVDLQ